MKALIFLAVIVVVKGAALHYAPAAVLETGASAQFRSEDNLGNYNFGYNEDHTSGGSFRREAGDAHGNVAGSYGLRDADGRVRVVNYIADDDGFRADIKTNEPGVEPKDPADATINKADTVVVKSVAVAAPVVEPIAVVPEPAPVALKSAYTFPAPVSVEKSSSISYSAPAHFVAQPVSYAFPEPAPVAVQKSSVAVAEPAAHTSKTTVTTYTSPVAVPVAEPAPISYAFPEPAPVPVAKTSVAVAEAAPVTYTFPAPSAPVAKTAVAYTGPLAVPAAHSKLSYSSQVQVNHGPALRAVAYAPAHYAVAAPAHYAVAAPAHYSHGHFAPASVVKSTGLTYAAHNPYYYGLYSPTVSYAGPVPYFTNIEYPGYPVVKK